MFLISSLVEIPLKLSRFVFFFARVNARRRALNAGTSPLHSFDRLLDKFMASLSNTELVIESLELELDSYRPGVKTSREHVLMQLKVSVAQITF